MKSFQIEICYVISMRKCPSNIGQQHCPARSASSIAQQDRPAALLKKLPLEYSFYITAYNLKAAGLL